MADQAGLNKDREYSLPSKNISDQDTSQTIPSADEHGVTYDCYMYTGAKPYDVRAAKLV